MSNQSRDSGDATQTADGQALTARRRDLLSRYFGAPPSAFDALEADLAVAHVPGGEWLFRQGDPADAMYFVLRGRMQVWIAPAADPAAMECVAEVSTGDSIGEVGLLTHGLRSAGARAIRDTTVLRIGAAAIDELIREYPVAARQIGATVARRLLQRTTGREEYRRTIRSIAVLRLHDSSAVADAAQALGQAMSEIGECRCLDSSILEGRNVLPGATEINRWLSTEEERHDILILEAGPASDAWSDLALRHADAVVLVADMTRGARRTEIEDQIDRRRELHSSRRFLMLVRNEDTDRPEGTATWLADRRLDGILHVRGRQRSDIARAARLATGRGIGLVLGGGGARGFAHIGVYRALSELGVAVDWVGGTSIGAVFGAGIALGTSPDEIVARAREAFVRGKPFGDITLPAVSLLKGKRMERLTRKMLPGQIEDLPTPFFCLATNLGRAETEVYDRGSIWRALRASTALPGVFPPAVMNRQLVVDGGVLNNLPVDIMRRKPVDTIIAVDLSSHKERQVDYDAVPSAMRLLAGRWLPFMRRPAVPGIMSLMLKGQELGSLVHARENRRLADLVLRPPVGHHGFADVRPFDRIVQAGYEDAREKVGQWLAGREGQGLAMAGKSA